MKQTKKKMIDGVQQECVCVCVRTLCSLGAATPLSQYSIESREYGWINIGATASATASSARGSDAGAAVRAKRRKRRKSG
jgi:hypothetical protein